MWASPGLIMAPAVDVSKPWLPLYDYIAFSKGQPLRVPHARRPHCRGAQLAAACPLPPEQRPLSREGPPPGKSSHEQGAGQRREAAFDIRRAVSGSARPAKCSRPPGQVQLPFGQALTDNLTFNSQTPLWYNAPVLDFVSPYVIMLIVLQLTVGCTT
jgi:hypothetical protein